MSRDGRESYRLGDLQDYARDPRVSSRVATLLLGEETEFSALVDHVRIVSDRYAGLGAADVLHGGEEVFTHPADWHYRTTVSDIREAVAEIARIKVGPMLAPYVQDLADGTTDLGVWSALTMEDLLRIKSVLERARTEFMRDWDQPVRVTKSPKVSNMPPRNEGPCSRVLYKRNGRFYDDQWQPLAPEDVEAYLRPVAAMPTGEVGV